MPFDPRVHQQRRARLADRIRAAGGGVAVVATAPVTLRNADVDHLFRHDSKFHYLTGFVEPEAALMLQVDADSTVATIFCRPRDPAREVWEGRRLGVEAAPATLGVDAAAGIETFEPAVTAALARDDTLFAVLGRSQSIEPRLLDWLKRAAATSRDPKRAAGRLTDIAAWIDEARLVKDAHEIALMQRAADISAAAHVDAMTATAAGMREYEIEAELLYTFRRLGAQHTAYPSVVASGANACVLHYTANDGVLGPHDLLLIDAGCEFDSYAADITRTYPVSGQFSAGQQALYEVVLAAQLAAIAATRAGARFDEPHEAAVRVLAQGLIDTGLVAGSLDGALESGSWKRYYLHRTGHWLGMDVHDVGSYRDETGNWCRLSPGMVVTVEPGLYVPAADDVDARFHDIGIRIEDDVVVTDRDATVLTSGVPKDVASIERLVGSRRRAAA
ncbi:aminopeptidase P N-terminal domain-containing protein [soil metagenome]